MINLQVPMARLLSLRFGQDQVEFNGQSKPMMVLKVEFRAPDADIYEHPLVNGDWSKGNAALQFMAKWGYQPTDFPEHPPKLDVEDDRVLIPVTQNPESGQWFLHELAMKNGEEALEDAEWFSPIEEHEDTTEVPVQSGGGGAGDPDGGGQVEVEQAPEESDRGINVAID